MSKHESFADELSNFFQPYLDNAYKQFRKMDELEREQFDNFVVWLQKIVENDVCEFDIEEGEDDDETEEDDDEYDEGDEDDEDDEDDEEMEEKKR